jgi:lysophospholipase L1-like esterase
MLKALSLALCLSAFASTDAVPLLANGDFTALDGKGLPVGWDFKGSAAHDLAIEKNADGHVLKVTVKKTGRWDGYILARQTLRLKPNTQYRLSCDIKSSAPNLAYAQVKLYQGKKEMKRHNTQRSRDEWRKAEVTFDSADSDRVAIFLRHKQDEKSLNQTACFRNVSLVEASEATEADTQPTIWLIGDSTVCNYDKKHYPQTGWGQILPELCKPGVQVRNHAIGGRSTKSFLDEKRWDKVLANLRPNDYVMIQFGHNDQKENKPEIYAPADSLYRELLKKYIAETRAKGAHPVLVTSVCRRLYKNDKIYNSLGTYPEAMKAVGAETGTPVIDLNAISLQKFNEIGVEGTKEIFMHLPAGKYEGWPEGRTDNSHFQEAGARQIARWVVTDAQNQKLPIAHLFSIGHLKH